MFCYRRLIALALVLAPMSALAGTQPQFQLLLPATVKPQDILPPPAARGSVQEAAELAAVHALIAAATPARMAQARWDDAHEDPSLFDAALGVKLATLPATWTLLKAVQNEGDAAADTAKVYFGRTRPWGVDPTVARCDAEPQAKPTRSYPSGHATLAYSTGFVLARLLPGHAAEVLARAADYALSRQICGVHFPSDTEASHVLGSVVALDLLANPDFRRMFEAARAELIAAQIPGSQAP